MRGGLRALLRIGLRLYLGSFLLFRPEPLTASVDCATPGKDGAGGTLAGIVNTYYPGTASAAVGDTTISVLSG